MKKKIYIVIFCLIVILGIDNISFAKELQDISVVKQGDYVTYEAGVWTEKEIAELVSNNVYAYYTPEGGYRTFFFSGFVAGDSRDVKKNGNGTFSTGWRILSNDNDAIKIISTGSTETYYSPFGENYAYVIKYELTGEKDENDNTNETEGIPIRDWSMYENPEYALSGYTHVATAGEIYDITGSLEADNNNLRNIGESYITSTVHCDEDMWTVEESGKMDRWGDKSLGIRPVIYLKPTLKVRKIGKSNDGYNIWKLINQDSEEVNVQDENIIEPENLIEEEYNETSTEFNNEFYDYSNIEIVEDVFYNQIDNNISYEKEENTTNKIFIIVFIVIFIVAISVAIIFFKKG